jgi:hypothetical protein
MVLTILIAWIALGALAVLFMYCCSRVSNGPRRGLMDDDFTADLPRRPVNTTGLNESGLSESCDFIIPSAQATERYPRLQ